MKRKVILLIISVVATLYFTACGGTDEIISEVADSGAVSEADGETVQAETTQQEAVSEEAVQEEAQIIIKDIEIPAEEIPDTDAFAYVADMKVGWNLGNTLEAHDNGNTPGNELSTETYWGNPKTTKEMIDAVKEAGFETIRIPITWRGHVTMEEDGTVVVSEAWLNRVKEVVDYAYQNDMYIIINTHHDVDTENGYYPNEENFERSEKYLTAVWTAMAEKFKDYDEHLILESFNEPRLVGTSYEWNFMPSQPECKEAVDCINRLNQTFVDIVRASGGNNTQRYLMIPGYTASPDGAMTNLYQLPTDSVTDKLIVSVHAYIPYAFALQSPEEGGSSDAFLADSPFATKDIDYMMERLYDKFISQGIPVVIDEFGARDKSRNLQARVDYYGYYVAAAKARGITCCVWDNNLFSGTGENFGLLQRKECSWLYPEIIEAIMKYA